jgi:hypothetical protein
MKHLIRNPRPFVMETDFYGNPIQSYIVPDAPAIVRDDTRLAAIYRLEDELHHLVPFECPLRHFFAEGVYLREMFIPAGVAIIGHVHRFSCVNVIAFGDIEIATEEGNRRVQGPTTFPSAAGTKRAGYALADTVWTTVHANPDNTRDIARLEERLIIPRVEALEARSCSPVCALS